MARSNRRSRRARGVTAAPGRDTGGGAGGRRLPRPASAAFGPCDEIVEMDRQLERDGREEGREQDPVRDLRAVRHARDGTGRPAGRQFAAFDARLAAMVRVRGLRPKITAFRLGLSAGLVFAGLHFANNANLGIELPVISRIEHAAQDYALTGLRGPRTPSGRVVIVGIDEKSVQEEGLWPWSRAKIARIVDELAKGGAVAVGFDVIWSERDDLGRKLARMASIARKDPGDASEALKALREVWKPAGGAEPYFLDDADTTEKLADSIEK